MENLNITYHSAKSSMRIRQYAKMALDNHCFVRGWLLKDTLTNMMTNFHHNTRIVVAKCNGKVIGVCVYDHNEKFWSYKNQIYVKRDFRRRGIGKTLIEKIIKIKPDNCRFSFEVGSQYSYSFYRAIRSNEKIAKYVPS